MVFSVELVILLTGFIILLGFVSRLLFERTNIPDVLILMGFGVLLGQSLGVEARLLIYRFAPYVGTLALIMILFEGGLHIEPGRALEQVRPAMALSGFSLAVTALLIADAAIWLWRWEFIPALLLGLVLGCTSSAIVIPVAQSLTMPESTRTLVRLEAAFSDTFAIVALFAVIGMAEARHDWLAHGVTRFGMSLGLAVGAAVAVSAVWVVVLEYTKQRPLSYLLTFAAILLLYGLVERWHGSGPVAVLTFGILVTESKRVRRWLARLRLPSPAAGQQEAHATVQWFHQEMTFLARTFFFVYLGLLFERERLSAELVTVCAVLAGLIVLGRAVSVYLLRRSLTQHSTFLIGVFLPRGLVSAILATWPVHHGIPGTGRFLDYTVPVIILTNAAMTLGLLFVRKAARPEAQTPSTGPGLLPGDSPGRKAPSRVPVD